MKNNGKQKAFVIPFHGEKIAVIQEKDKETLIPLKQLCDNLGLSWQGQHKRIKEDMVLGATVSVTETVAPDGKIRKTLTLPLEFLNGFLFTISDKRLKNEKARKKLLVYKKECYKVLFEYFNQGFALNIEKLKEPAVQEELVSVVKKAVNPLAFESEELQYTFFAEENLRYGKTVSSEAHCIL